MSGEDEELFEAADAGVDEAGVEEGFGCVVGAAVDADSDGAGVPFTFAGAEEDVGTTEGVESEEGGTQV